ncbi:type VI secretion system ATPase TssH [Granulicella tundricola]|uniref:Type VI secretion ATPase, ClpV1 family n=1 Tax=Granulicella tundricola (strain ATCC BAA-1859 / DSM 23138 / MP5ACTX9) TaxID=1198114 RepID=E8X5Q9_GRATM|nr:type VI secretion system ATPase TssH [Granulicella tundricola]ADW70793.1 type VI secretion ATPase, ClpV1 family [Granulicella tundricola MP5ACTX9]
MSLNLKSLIAKLNDTTRSVLEASAGLCMSRTHYDIEIEHYLVKAMESSDNDIASILKHYGVDKSRLSKELDRALDNIKTGNARSPAFSPQLVKMLAEAWTVASIEYDAGSVRTGFTLLALLTHEDLARAVKEISRELQKIEPEGLRKDFYTIVANSREVQASLKPTGGTGDATTSDGPAAGKGKTPNLDQYCVNLTGNAKAGKIDPVLGRDAEVRQMIDILMRRRQNNPILTGEAGVGKTAVVEGLANRIVQGDVPPALQGVHLYSLDLALLQAGASVKGEFEQRLKGLINEVKSSTEKIILFIDEAHTMIGAGGTAGQNDAANLLKPALARGELRTIAATTWSEYKKYFEKDPALARRFQVVKVEEPSEEVCCTMLRGIVASLEKHHGLRILDEAIVATVKLSHRYIAGRQLPDKAVSVLDTACARLALGQNSMPPQLEDVLRTIDSLEVQKRVLERENVIGASHGERVTEIDEKIAKNKATLEELKERWEKEKALVSGIRTIQIELEAEPKKDEAAAAEARKKLGELEAELLALQGETGLMSVSVDAQICGAVISAWTGIPLGKMMKDEISTVLTLAEHLKKRVIGQDHALAAIAQRILTSKANMDDPVKPIGVFMLVGPSGVGKTETAIALADLLYGGEKNMITINMSEFQEAHTVSTLKGSPPGYVGYGEGGVLTEAVRRRPYSVVLLDECEKAHPDVLELFFQVFDKGRMEDGEGREIDFRNTIILLTSNAATDTLMKLCADPETMPFSDGLLAAIKPELNKIFKPAFLGRMITVPYFPVRDEALKQIIRLKLGKIQKRLRETHKVTMTYDDALLNEVASRCTEVESGARNVDNILSNTMLPEISRQMLGKLAEGETIESVAISVADGKMTYDWQEVAKAA